jgi:ATP-dependent DNA helicase RecG
MFLGELRQEVSTLRGVGPATAARLARVGVRSLSDLLLYAPRGYDDRTRLVPLSLAGEQERACVEATVVDQSELGRGRARTVRAAITDGTGQASLVCFGRAFLRTVLVPGRKFYVAGSFKKRRGELECTDFELEPWSAAPSAFGRILPVYPLTEGLTQAAVRRAVQAGLAAAGSAVENELPAALHRARALMDKAAALAGLHFPADAAAASQSLRTLSYEELFWFELLVLRRRLSRSAVRGAARTLTTTLRDRLVTRLPFSLTAGQAAACEDIRGDLSSPAPMARLLQGDVGCGKTLVALLSAALLIPVGEQAAFVAPTELLARQHADNAARWLEPAGVRTAFISGSVTGEPRRLLLAALAAGEIDILFGTHAVFSVDVVFRSLGLVIVDEQHKFGVLQRMAMLQKGASPDLLLMTATPIPRTLALTAFGDLDVSTIRTMPAGRLPTVTHLARQGNEEKVYRRVREEIDKGRQAYFVYPLIGESEALGLKNAEGACRHLAQTVYPDLTVALVHSRVPEEETARVMGEFAAGRIHVLVATSVVEVGVDVGNATCMVVEHAERFGLSTLHQLRGRVGRGPHQSYAFLIYGRELTPDGIERLKVMMETTDGFVVAEKDMRLRGPGELLGVRQSGFLRFRVADLLSQAELLQQARQDAEGLLAGDPGFLLPENAVIPRLLSAAPPFPDTLLDGG